MPIKRSIFARICLVVLIATYLVTVGLATLRNHWGFGTFGFDLGIFDQGVWLLSRFHEPFVTVMGLNLFGDHASFFLVLVAPLYWLMPSASVLLGLQTLALGMAAVPLFLIARHVLRNELVAVAGAAMYLLHPAVAWTNFENFHPDSFEVPILFLVLYAMLKRSWVPFLVGVVALLTIKEDVPLLTAGLGIYVALFHDRKIGLITLYLSLVWLFVAIGILFPALNGVGTLDEFRVPFGGFRGFFSTLFTRPWEVAAVLWEDERRWYAWQLFASTGLLFVLAPALALVALGPLFSNLLSTFWYQYHIQYHYTTLIVPILVTASIVGAAKLRSRRVRTGLMAAGLAASAIAAYMWGPMFFARHPAPVADPTSAQVDAVYEAIALVPPDATVSAFYSYVPHLTHRRLIYEFPNPWSAANWGDFSMEGQRLPEAADVEYVVLPEGVEGRSQEVLEMIRSDFEEIDDVDGIVVLRKIAT